MISIGGSMTTLAITGFTNPEESRSDKLPRTANKAVILLSDGQDNRSIGTLLHHNLRGWDSSR
jgi:hypothetical protein